MPDARVFYYFGVSRKRADKNVMWRAVGLMGMVSITFWLGLLSAFQFGTFWTITTKLTQWWIRKGVGVVGQ